MLITRKDNKEGEDKQSIKNKKYTLFELDRFIYDAESIENFRMDEAIQDHPLSRRPTNMRSKLAYS